MGVGGLGGDDLEDPAAEDLQCLGVVVLGELEQVPLGLVDKVGVEVVGRSARALRMASACSTWTRPCGERAWRVWSRLSSPSASRIDPVRGGAGGAGGGARASSRSRTRRCRRRCRCASAWDRSRAFELGELGLGGLDSSIGGGGLGGVHRPHRHPRDLAELIAHTSERPGDRVRLVRDRCHGPIPAPTTDTRRGRNALVDKGFRCLGCGRKVAFQRGLRWSRQARPAVGERVPSLGGAGVRRGLQPPPGPRASPPARDRDTRTAHTLGCRVAAPNDTRDRWPAPPSAGCGGIDRLDRRWAPPSEAAVVAAVSRRSQSDVLNQRVAPDSTTADPQQDRRRQPDSQPIGSRVAAPPHVTVPRHRPLPRASERL